MEVVLPEIFLSTFSSRAAAHPAPTTQRLLTPAAAEPGAQDSVHALAPIAWPHNCWLSASPLHPAADLHRHPLSQCLTSDPVADAHMHEKR